MSKQITGDALYLHVAAQAVMLVNRVRTWLVHPTFDSKVNLRKGMQELEGMWRMALVLTDYPQTVTDSPQYNAAVQMENTRRIIRELDELRKVNADRNLTDLIGL